MYVYSCSDRTYTLILVRMDQILPQQQSTLESQQNRSAFAPHSHSGIPAIGISTIFQLYHWNISSVSLCTRLNQRLEDYLGKFSPEVTHMTPNHYVSQNQSCCPACLTGMNSGNVVEQSISAIHNTWTKLKSWQSWQKDNLYSSHICLFVIEVLSLSYTLDVENHV